MEVREVSIKGRHKKSWQEYRNLSFFHGLQPKYFYFNLLFNHWEGHEAYNSLANSIGEEAKSQFTHAVEALKTGTDDKDNTMDRLQIIIPLLDQIITQETSNEQAYFKQKYSTFKNAFSAEELKALPELNELLNFLKNPTINGAIDYDNFILAINVALQGYDNAIAAIRYEGNRINQLEGQLAKAISYRGSQVYGLAKSRDKNEKERLESQDRAEKKFQHKIQQHFLKYKSLKDPHDKTHTRYMRGLTKYLTDLPSTIDVLITEWLRDNIKAAFESNEVREELVNILKAQWPDILHNGNTVETEKKMIAFLIQKFQSFSVNHIAEIIENRVQATYKEIINYTNENLNFDFDIQGYSPDIFIKTVSPKYFNEPQAERTSAEGLFNSVADLRKRVAAAVRNETENQLKKEERQTYNFIFNNSNIQKLNNKNYTNIFRFVEELEAIKKQIEEAEKKHTKEKIINLSDKRLKKMGINKPITISIKDGKIINEDNFIGIINERARELGINLQTTKHINSAINAIKTQTSRNIKALLDAYIKGDKIIKDKSSKQISDMVEVALTKISVHISAPTEAEIIEGLQFSMRGNSLVLQWTGPSNVKNDFVVIDVNLPEGGDFKITVKDLFGEMKTEVEEIVEKQIEKAQEEVATTVGQNLTSIAETFAKQQKYNQHKEIAKEANKQKDDFLALEENYEKLLSEDMPNLKSLLKRLDDLYGPGSEKALEKKQALLKTFYNFFYQSSTTKTYNNFLNTMGFQGGSIGPNITAQIEKINEMFAEAGGQLSKTDEEWLIGAVINCSHFSVMGDAQRQDIEYYLGALATLTLFDEAAFEQSIITQMKDASKRNASMSIFHLYRLNGLYYPGSFVLKQARDSLAIYINQIIETVTTVRHGGIGIIGGGLTPNDLPNKGLLIPEDYNPWETVSGKAQENASIKVLFLAGLLDTLNAIQEKMNNIELPG